MRWSGWRLDVLPGLRGSSCTTIRRSQQPRKTRLVHQKSWRITDAGANLFSSVTVTANRRHRPFFPLNHGTTEPPPFELRAEYQHQRSLAGHPSSRKPNFSSGRDGVQYGPISSRFLRKTVAVSGEPLSFSFSQLAQILQF